MMKSWDAAKRRKPKLHLGSTLHAAWKLIEIGSTQGVNTGFSHDSDENVNSFRLPKLGYALYA
jgi:hypothetical protein